MKLTDEQEAQVALIAGAAARLREAKATAYERARKQVEDEIRSFEIEVQKEVARGEAAGISYSQMAKRGLGLQNGTTAKQYAEEGRRFIDVEAEQEIAQSIPVQKYAFDPASSTLTVTLQPEDFEGKLAGVTQEQSLTFEVDGVQLLPEGDLWNHPVARLVLSESGKREALAYIEQTTTV